MSAGHSFFPLSKAEIESVVSRLSEGDYLDDHLRARLFREPREIELTYAEKEPRGRVLAGARAVPMQVIKRFGSASGGWMNQLIFGDNLQVLKTLVRQKAEGRLSSADGTPGVRLCYIDPPFASRQDLQGRSGETAYSDRVSGAQFVEFLRKRLVLIHELIAADGALYVHLDSRKVHYIKIVLDEIFGEQNFRNQIIWRRTSAHSSADRYGPVHDVILFYSKSDSFIWNPQYTPYDQYYLDQFYTHIDPDGRRWRRSDLTARGIRRKATGQPWRGIDVSKKNRHWTVPPDQLEQLDSKGRIHWPEKADGMPMLKRYADEQKGVPLQDVWTDIRPLHNLAPERTGYPTQKPATLIERMVLASTGPGDLVLDCFAGSGTTAVVCSKLERRWLAVDCGKYALYVTQKRLVTDAPKQASLTGAHSFEVLSAGHYDNEALERLEFDEYCRFALELFNCRAVRKKVSEIEFCGTRSGFPVHIYPFHTAPGLDMGRAYLKSVADRLAGKVAGVVYVIAPLSSCDPGLFEDIVRCGDIDFVILRIPYSLISAVTERQFHTIEQARSEQRLNDPGDAVGFDFVELPCADVKYSYDSGQLVGELRTFTIGGADPDDVAVAEDGGRGDLAMIMVDPRYDGEEFRIELSFFADELRDRDWRFQLSVPSPEASVCVILLDRLGNELRHIVEVASICDGR